MREKKEEQSVSTL